MAGPCIHVSANFIRAPLPIDKGCLGDKKTLSRKIALFATSKLVPNGL